VSRGPHLEVGQSQRIGHLARYDVNTKLICAISTVFLSTLNSSNVVNTKVAITVPSLESGFDYDILKACRTHQPKPVTCASDAAVGWPLSLGGANNFLVSIFGNKSSLYEDWIHHQKMTSF
jgi:hypothetical protein